MRFAHVSDTHLGFRQYGLSEREEDFYLAFEEAVARIIEERPDFVLHSGDMFDFHRPQPRALWVAQKCFSRLSDKGIPVYAITGNHDVLLRRGTMPPQVLFASMNVRLITEEEPFIVHKGVLIAGCPWTSKYYASRLVETLSILAKRAEKYRKSVLMLHQGIDRFLPQEFELGLEQIPGKFDYCAMGHVHSRIVHEFGKGFLAYPGSTELWSASEYDDWKKNGKGFFIVDLDGDRPSVQSVDVPLARDIIRERIDASQGTSSAEKAVHALKAKISEMRSKPLLYLDVDAEGPDRRGLHETLTSRLSGSALSLRISFSAKKEAEAGNVLSRTFDIQGMIKEAVKDPGLAGLASALFAALSEGDEERALRDAEEFYSKETESGASPPEADGKSSEGGERE